MTEAKTFAPLFLLISSVFSHYHPIKNSCGYVLEFFIRLQIRVRAHQTPFHCRVYVCK